jgi:AsmA protein
MTRRHRLLLALAGAAALALAAAAIFLARLDAAALTRRLEERLSAALGLEVRALGATELRLLPRPRAVFADVLVRDGEEELLRVKRVTAGIALLPLLGGKTRLATLALEEPVLTLRRHRDGSFNLGRRPQRPKPKEPFLLATRGRAEGGTIRYRDEETGTEAELGGLALTLRKLRRDADGQVAFSGELRAGRLRVNRVEMQGLQATLTAAGGVYRAEPLRLELFGAAAKGQLQVDRRKEQPAYRLELAAGGLSLAQLFQALAGEALFEGSVDLQATLTAEGPGSILRRLDGTVNVAGAGLVQRGFDLDGVIREFRQSQRVNLVDVGAYVFAGPVGALVSKGFDTAGLYRRLKRDKSQAIEQIVFNWTLKNGVARTVDVALRTRENRLAFSGAVDLVGSRYAGLTLGLLDEKGCAELTEEITGPLAEPAVEKRGMARYLAGPVAGILLQGWEIIDPRECRPFYRGSVAHPKVERGPFSPLKDAIRLPGS